jgi:nucleotide-binding universal stress UspA family protein
MVIMKKRPEEMNRNTICWAVDPFQDNYKYHLHALKVILPFRKALNVNIQPVSFVSSEHIFINRKDRAALKFQDIVQIIAAAVNQRFEQIFTSTQRKLFLKPQLLSNREGQGITLAQKILAIDRYAKKIDADFVALHSHSRKGIKRFFIGSFAETFVLHSQLPTLIINPICEPARKIRTVIFPTDFSKESVATFRLAGNYAKKLGANLQIIHTISKPKLSIFLSGAATVEQQSIEVEQRKILAARQAERLLKICRKSNVPAEFNILENSGAFDPAKSVLEFSKNYQSPIIILAAKSSSMRASIIGATSREIARAANCPVLIHRK